MSADLNTLRIEGEMTIYRAAEIKQQLTDFLAAAGAAGVTLDLAEVSEIDCSGVQLLAVARDAARAAGGQLRLAAPSAAVTEVCGLLRLPTLLAD
ncbi:MAG TPA: STAS domain-containing protein [Burkholderiales bacterium]|jgi:anti-anti-sigma factor